jgi:ketosteroid isomerase-like protein
VERPGDLDTLDLVRRFYAAFNAGALDEVMALCADSIEYVNPPDAAESGTRVGQRAVRRALEGLADGFEGFRCEIEDLTRSGDGVLVVTRSTGRGRTSGIPFDEVQGHLLTLEGGLITRFEWFRDLAAARSAERDRLARDDGA